MSVALWCGACLDFPAAHAEHMMLSSGLGFSIVKAGNCLLLAIVVSVVGLTWLSARCHTDIGMALGSLCDAFVGCAQTCAK